MDEAEGRAVHKGDSRAQCSQQEKPSEMHQCLDQKVEVCSLEVFTLEVDGEAFLKRLSQEGHREEVVDRQKARHQVFAEVESALVLKDERSS